MERPEPELTGRSPDSGLLEGEREHLTIGSPLVQTPHIHKYLATCHDNRHSSCPSILVFGLPCLENFALLNEGIGLNLTTQTVYFCLSLE